MIKEEMTLLDSFKVLLGFQQELVRLSLEMSVKGPVLFKDEQLICTLSDSKKGISSYLTVAGGQSAQTILGMTKLKGFPVRDAYSIARTVIESFINASYLLSESEKISERAKRYIEFADWRHCNRSFGTGEFKIKLSTFPNTEELIQTKYPEFFGKGNSSWTSLDVPNRISKVGELAGARAGSRLIAAYTLIYSIASEIIHGSPYGAAYFYSTHLLKEKTSDEFDLQSIKHMEQILLAVLHAVGGYISTFYGLQNMSAPLLAEAEIHKVVLDLFSKPRDSFPAYDLSKFSDEI